jgi:hypothetical protein
MDWTCNLDEETRIECTVFVRRSFECSNTEKDVVDNIKTNLREECYENLNSLRPWSSGRF